MDDFGKRRFPRTAAHLQVFYSYENDLIETSTYATDISGSGLAFFSDEKFDHGEILNLEVKLKGSRHNVHGKAKVIRSEPCEESEYNLTAVEFTDMDMGEKIKMLDYSLELYADNRDGVEA